MSLSKAVGMPRFTFIKDPVGRSKIKSGEMYWGRCDAVFLILKKPQGKIHDLMAANGEKVCGGNH